MAARSATIRFGNIESATSENDYGIWLAPGTINTTVFGKHRNGMSMTNASSTAFAPVGIRDTGGAASSGNNITQNTGFQHH
jgi:hypothetical protein